MTQLPKFDSKKIKIERTRADIEKSVAIHIVAEEIKERVHQTANDISHIEQVRVDSIEKYSL